jgi:hypothetical protein
MQFNIVFKTCVLGVELLSKRVAKFKEDSNDCKKKNIIQHTAEKYEQSDSLNLGLVYEKF